MFQCYFNLAFRSSVNNHCKKYKWFVDLFLTHIGNICTTKMGKFQCFQILLNHNGLLQIPFKGVRDQRQVTICN